MKGEVFVARCLVIGQERVGEHNLRLAIFSESGITRATATGILKPTAKLRGALQLFNQVEVTIQGQKITGAHLVQNNTTISRDINRYYLANSICESVGKLLREPTEETRQIYEITRWALAELAHAETSCYKILIYFYDLLLSLLGFSISLDFNLDDDLKLSRARGLITELQTAYADSLEFSIPLVSHFL